MAGFLDALARFFSPTPGTEPPAQRGLTYAQVWGSGADWEPYNSTAGVAVNSESAMRSIAVQAAVRLLVNDIGSLPVDAFRSADKGKTELPRPEWVVTPNPLNPNETWEDHVKQVVYSILTDGNGFSYVFPSVFDPQSVTALDPGSVDVRRTSPLAEATYLVRGIGELSSAQVLHIPWMTPPGAKRGLNPIEAGKQGIGIALAADEFVGSYFGNGAILSGVIEYPQGVEPDPTQVAALKADFQRKHVGARKSHAVGALTGGAQFKPFDYNNRNAQLLELRDQIVEEVARLFGIPPHMLGSQKPGAVGYASVEQRSIDYVTHAVLPIVRRIEVAYSRLLRGQQSYLRFNLEGLKRGDQAARATFYGTMLQNKVIRREEVRELEELPFDPESVGYLETPNNNPPDEAPAEPRSAPNVTVNTEANLPESWVERIETLAADRRERELRERGWLDESQAERFLKADDLAPVGAALDAIRDKLDAPVRDGRVDALLAAAKRPVRKVVERDAQGLIVSVTEVPAGGD